MAKTQSKSVITAYPLFIYLLVKRWTIAQSKGKGRGRPDIGIQSTAAAWAMLTLVSKLVINNKQSINNYSQALLLKALFSLFTGNKASDVGAKLASAESESSSLKVYTVKEQPYGTKRSVKVILMGAGASTLNFLKQAEDGLSNVTITCYEKNADVGGTWLENRYPGCACDIPSVNYQFTWKIKLWKHYYSFAPEIWEYLKEVEVENGFIGKYIRLRHRVESAEWDSEAGLWRLKIRNLETDELLEDEADFFINAGGVLNSWKWPEIAGLHDFKGKLMHSASYDQDYDTTGKKIAVVGAGSSGVQIVTALQPKVEQLFHWVKSPIWITAGFAQRWAGEDGANFTCEQHSVSFEIALMTDPFPITDTKEQHEYLKQNPKKYLEYRKQIENELNQRFRFIIKGSQEFNDARTYSEAEMRRKLKDNPRLCNTIIPKTFNPGCRRPTPAPGYLEALVAPNVTVFTDSISKIDATGFIDHSGTHHDVDAIICATGFDTTWIPSFPFTGANNITLKDLWGPDNGVTSYLSIGIPHFPNYFSFCGPYGPLAHGSFMPLIECWTRYMFSVITKAQIEGIKSFTPSARAAAQFRQHADAFLKRTAWTQPCSSWFKQGRTDGQAAVYPGSRVHFLELLKAPRYEDYEIEYLDDNRFAFLGNGFATREEDGRDITDYLGSLDLEGRDVQPQYGDAMIDILGGCHIEKES
jgi:cation diffusion facilitator CzcD-associated flavoprotein CzcO